MRPVFGSIAAAGSVPARCSLTAVPLLAATPLGIGWKASGAGDGVDPGPAATAYGICDPTTENSGWSLGELGRDGVPPKSPSNTTPRSPLGSTSGIEPMPGSGS